MNRLRGGDGMNYVKRIGGGGEAAPGSNVTGRPPDDDAPAKRTDLTAALARALKRARDQSHRLGFVPDNRPDQFANMAQAALAAEGIYLVDRETLAAALRPALDLLYQPPEMVGGDHALAIAAALLAELEK